MGPRLFSRGEDKVKKEHTMIVGASMGPRLFSRGEETNFCEAMRKRGPNDTTTDGGLSV